MKLYLLNTNAARFSSIENGYEFTEKVSLLPDLSRSQSQCSSTAELANKLVSELTKEDGSSTLKIKVTTSGSSPTASLSLQSESNFNVLKELSERFQDKVQISISIFGETRTCNRYDHSCAIFAVEGINPECFTCVHSCYAHCLPGYGNMKVQVIAHIPDQVLTLTPVERKTREILEEELGHDVIITAGNGVEIKAHQCFLIGSSSVLRSMFGSGMTESQTGRIDMTDITESGIRALLRYIYFNETIGRNGDLSAMYDLFYAAHKYDVKALETLMMSYLLSRNNQDFDPKVALKIYTFVRNLESAANLKTKMVDIFQMKFDELKALQEYKDLFNNPSNAMQFQEDFANRTLKRKSDNTEQEPGSKVMKKK